VQVYGASETGGLGWRSSHRDPYRLLPYLERVSGDAGETEVLRHGPDGGTHARCTRRTAWTWQGPQRLLCGG
jgi:long-chain acyl-CoA synthetase